MIALQKQSIKQRTFLWKNDVENVHRKLVPDLLLIFVNKPKQPLQKSSLENKIF